MQVLPQAFPLVQYLQHTLWAARKVSVPQEAGVGQAMRGNDNETATTSAQANSVRPGLMSSALRKETGAEGVLSMSSARLLSLVSPASTAQWPRFAYGARNSTRSAAS